MEKDVVQGRGAEGEFLGHQALFVEPEGYGADQRCAVGDADGDFAAVDFHRRHRGDVGQGFGGSGGIAIQPRHDQVGAAVAFQFIGGALGGQTAAVDDADAPGQGIGFLQVLGSKENGYAHTGVDFPDFVPDAGAADGVEAGGRFVQE